MSIKELSLISSKIKRSPEKMDIHNLFIFRNSGICLYSRNFTNYYDMEENLISSFFTALRSFTQEIVGKNIETIEMGNLKFTIIKKNKYLYGFLSDIEENVLLLEDIAEKINIQYLKYVKLHNVNTTMEYIYSKDFDRIIDETLENILSNEFDLRKEAIIIKYLKELNSNAEVEGVILLTDKGKVIFSSLRSYNVKKMLKEVDFRIKIHNNAILKMFYMTKNNDIIFSENINDLYFLILMFNFNTKFGISEYYLKKAVDYLKKTLDT